MNDITYRKCYICNEVKSIDNFHNDKHQSGGKHYHCKECSKILSKKWQFQNPIKYWCRYVLHNHRNKGFDIRIDKSELEELAIQTTHCPICNVPFTYNNGTNGRQRTNSPSLDRIDNEDILTIDNVWIICLGCNTTKYNKSMKQFVEYCSMVSRKFKHLL